MKQIKQSLALVPAFYVTNQISAKHIDVIMAAQLGMVCTPEIATSLREDGPKHDAIPCRPNPIESTTTLECLLSIPSNRI